MQGNGNARVQVFASAHVCALLLEGRAVALGDRALAYYLKSGMGVGF
jgi:hypothetical protein